MKHADPGATQTNMHSPWPHRLAVLLACATFPLIWVGGMVTTYDAGMAVPDWPGTYGYNLFLYPWTTWILGPFDLFIEHGHRLLGATVGLIAIVLVVAAFRGGSPRWVRIASLGALALVIFQGVLGGARVVMDERTLALLHGCTGPVFFAYAVGLAICTSARWRNSESTSATSTHGIQRLAVVTACLTYAQLLIGAQVRHIPVTASPDAFRAVVLFHLLMAAVVIGHMTFLAWRVWRNPAATALRRPALLLLGLGWSQVALGALSWLLKYGWPGLLTEQSYSAAHLIVAKSYTQALIVTGHVALGSLLLATAVWVVLRALRRLRAETVVLGSAPLLWGLAG